MTNIDEEHRERVRVACYDPDLGGLRYSLDRRVLRLVTPRAECHPGRPEYEHGLCETCVVLCRRWARAVGDPPRPGPISDGDHPTDG